MRKEDDCLVMARGPRAREERGKIIGREMFQKHASNHLNECDYHMP